VANEQQNSRLAEYEGKFSCSERFVAVPFHKPP